MEEDQVPLVLKYHRVEQHFNDQLNAIRIAKTGITFVFKVGQRWVLLR